MPRIPFVRIPLLKRRSAPKKPSLFFPIIDNGMGLSRTRWGASMFHAALSGVLDGREIVSQSLSYPYPDDAMNVSTQDFLDSKCDEMIVIDTDILYLPCHLQWLLEHTSRLVFGMYPLKEPGLTFPISLLPNMPNPFIPLEDDLRPHEYLCEVGCCARGFMRVHRSIFEQMASHCETRLDRQLGREHKVFWENHGQGEDFNFCNLARKLGIPVLVDRRITTQHEGAAIYPIPGTFAQ